MTISPSKDCWSRYDIDTNFRVLAEWLGPDVPRAMTLPELQWLSGAQESCESAKGTSGKLRIVAWLTRVNRGGGQLDFPPTPPFADCSHVVLIGAGVCRRGRIATFEEIRGRDRSSG